MKFYCISILLFATLHAKEIHPTYKFKAYGSVNDFCVTKDKIYIATDAGVVDIYSLKSKKRIDQIALTPLTTVQGIVKDAHIISIDVRDEKVLFVSTTVSGYRNVWLYQSHKLSLVVDENKQLSIKEARFVDDEKVMFATLGADMILFDLGESYNAYRSHVSDSKIGDYQLSADKKTMLIADESGAVKIINVAEAKLINEPTPLNVDNIFHVAYANGVVLTAGQDRRVGVYLKYAKPYYIKTSFFVYCVGLSPSAKIGVYTKGEENVLQLFNPQTKQNSHKLVGHKGIVNQIKFINEHEFYSSDRASEVYFWKF